MQNTPSPSDNLKVTKMVKSGKDQAHAIDRGAGIFESQGIGNSYLITTPDGNILVNTGTLADAQRAKPLFEAISTAPIHYIILTQSHANQFGGLELYKTADNQVIAHKIYTKDRTYSRALQPHYKRGSGRIFRSITGDTSKLLPTQEVAPDLLIEEDYRLTLGGREFEILWTPGGETRSALVVWLPNEKIAIVGNLFGPLFGNQPNLNTIRGDKPRSALEFVESVHKLRELGPEQILTGHENIHGYEHIQTELARIINSVQWIHDKTIDGMNAGLPLHELMAIIKPPKELTLTEEYGRVAWNVRAIWHEYTGWFNPARGTTELYAVPISAVAPSLIELSGGAEKVTNKATDFLTQQKPLEALHLLDLVLAADTSCQQAEEVKKQALLLLQQQTGGKNLWERMWIASEIQALDNQQPL